MRVMRNLFYAAPQVGYVLLGNTRVPSNRQCNLAFMGSDDRVVDYLGSDGKHICLCFLNTEQSQCIESVHKLLAEG